MSLAFIVQPAVITGVGWFWAVLASVLIMPILVIAFAPQQVRLTWKRIVGCLATIALLTALAGAQAGIICFPCQNCDPWWIQFGICIPK